MAQKFYGKWADPEYRVQYYRKYRQDNLEKRRNDDRERQRKLRLKALIHYGGNPPKCNCCGESEIKFLSFDHINGGGNKERNETSRWIGQYLRQMNYPEGFQVLCYNCNLSKGFYKICPHKLKSST